MAQLSLENATSVVTDALANQRARLFDVYALGPLLLWTAFASGKGKLDRWPRRALFSAGVFTILYNIGKYQELAKKVTA